MIGCVIIPKSSATLEELQGIVGNDPSIDSLTIDQDTGEFFQCSNYWIVEVDYGLSNQEAAILMLFDGARCHCCYKDFWQDFRDRYNA